MLLQVEPIIHGMETRSLTSHCTPFEIRVDRYFLDKYQQNSKQCLNDSKYQYTISIEQL